MLILLVVLVNRIKINFIKKKKKKKMIKFSITIFYVGFPTLCYRLRNLFICRREQSICHVVSTWREDWVPLAKIITLMTHIYRVLFYGAF